MTDTYSLSVVNDAFLLKLNITDLSQQFVTTTETTEVLENIYYYNHLGFMDTCYACGFQPKKSLCSPQIQEFKQNGKPYIQ